MKETKHYFEVGGLKVFWNFWLLPSNFIAITFFGCVLSNLKYENLKKYLESYKGYVMINHERIHMLQANSFILGYFTFYILYLWYWIKELFKYRFNNNLSYYNIPFEKEAFDKELDFKYSSSKWKKYI